MSIEVRVPGRVGPHRESHESRLLATNFVKAATAAIPSNSYTNWTGSHNIVNWGMDNNDQWGCCGGAAVDHGNVAKANNTSLIGTLGQPKFAGMLQTYWAYGIAQGEVGQSPDQSDQPDFGVDNATWLGFLYKSGLIDGYGEVPLDQLDYFAPLGSGLLTGQILYQGCEQDFTNHVPWGSTPETPDNTMGHDTWLINLHSDGSFDTITWGAVQRCTLYYRQNNLTDAWIIWDKDDPSVDWPALKGALNAVHGTQVAVA